jgi:hypothetical protein
MQVHGGLVEEGIVLSYKLSAHDMRARRLFHDHSLKFKCKFCNKKNKDSVSTFDET